MEQFVMEHRSEKRFGAYFPENLIKTRQVWGYTLGQTEGSWQNYRFVIGPLKAVREEIKKVADEYSYQRKQYPHIDTLKLFEGSQRIWGTDLMYYDYAGRISVFGRESVLLHTDDGQKIALERNNTIGFRGIIVRTEKPWSMETFALNELTRFRMLALHLGRRLKGIDTREPWKLVDAATRALISLIDVAYQDYISESTPAKLEVLIEIQKKFYQRLATTYRWLHYLPNWEFMEALPFVGREGAIKLWEEDKMNSLNYEQTEPWWTELKKEEFEVSAIRKADLQTPRYLIELITNPELQMYEHPFLNVFHQALTYGPHLGVGPSIPHPNKSERFRQPTMGMKKDSSGWNGQLPVHDEWEAMHTGPNIPAYKLRVRTKEVQIRRSEAEYLTAALSQNRPTLVFRNLNGAVCPQLVLPAGLHQTRIYPLVAKGLKIESKDANCKVEGSTIWAGPSENTRKIFDDIPTEFLTTPSSNRPSYEGVQSEIIPEL